jgi:hypothetical protein
MYPATGALGGVGAMVARAISVDVGAIVAGAIGIGVAHAVKPIVMTSKVS